MTPEYGANFGRGVCEITVSCESTGLHEYEALFKKAEEELARGEYSLSIIMSHASIEIITERAFVLLFSYKKIDYLYDAIVKPSWKYNNLSNDRVRKLYSALSGEDFSKNKDLWDQLDTHMNKRHKIAHRGVMSSREEAELSVEVARKYIVHLSNSIESLKPSDWGV
jgi:hypothetical protein